MSRWPPNKTPSFTELTGDPCWRQEHTFPNDEDIAGITLLSWDVDEADDVLFLQEQYKEVVAKVASDWETAVRAAVTAFRPSERHRTPGFVRRVFP